MKSSKQSLENHLLVTSGVIAIGLAAVANSLIFTPGPALALYLAFGALFVVMAYIHELGLPPRFGHIGALAMLGLSTACLLVHPTTLSLILAVVMMASAPYHLGPRQAWLLLFIANAAYLAVFHFYWNAENYLLSFISLLALQGFAITSSLTRQREISIQEELRSKNAELLEARAALAEKSQAEERLRIAGELHDTIGHQLTALRLQLEALAYRSPDSLKPQVENCQQMSADLLERIRGIVRQMSREQREDLASAIQQLASITPAVNINVSTPLPALPPALNRQLVYCFREAINNAIRHGAANHIDIAWRDRCFRITDNGNGPVQNPGQGFGLGNIESRLAQWGGHVELSRAEPGGGRLDIHLPLQGSMPT